MLLTRLLRQIVKEGELQLVDARGHLHVAKGPKDGPVLRLKLTDPKLNRRLFLNPNLVLGEAFMEGTLQVENGDVYDMLDFFGRNLGWQHPDHWPQRLLHVWRLVGRRLTQYNPVPRAQRNVAHHYDLSDTLYELFLDRDRQYSCAYFLSPEDSIDQAQENKKRHLANKLLLEPGQRVLDIGCGWGGLALHLAQEARVDVTGITLSQEQHKVAGERAQRAGLQERVHFGLQDYRQVQGRFDRIVSVGMFEHVGVGYYAAYFNKIRELLTDRGVAVLHTIGRADGPGATNPWIAKYIFPGGYVPALSEVLPSIERAGLYVTDIEVLRLHYAETLKAWRARFNKNRERIRQLYDERFCRMWEFYLAGSEVAFRHCGHVVFQIQLARQQDAVPLTRNYIYEAHRPAAMARSA